MKRFILFLAITMFSFMVMAQDYRTVNPSVTSMFRNGSYAIRIDSVGLRNSDTLLYPFNQIENLDGYCYTNHGTHWSGKCIIIKPSGENLFVNKFNDTIRIDTKAGINETWICYQPDASFYIEATISSFDTATFLGINDSVKTIHFQAYENGVPVSHSVNSRILRLSKMYGFVTILHFSLFPEDPEYGAVPQYSLAGLSEPKVGISNLLWKEVFDYNVGDEFHIYEYSSTWSSGFYVLVNQIKKILSKEIRNDSIIYSQEVRTRMTTHNSNIDTTIITIGTGYLYITNNSTFDKLPGEPVIISFNPSEMFTYSMGSGLNGIVSKVEPSFSEFYSESSSDSCWVQLIVDGCLPSYEYLKGFGGSYYFCDAWNQLDERKLVYYKKDTIIWGTPYVIELPSAYLETSADTIVISEMTSSKDTLFIHSNVSWTIGDSIPAWVSISKLSGSGNDTIIFQSLEANPNETPRYFDLEITASGVSPVPLVIKQKGKTSGISEALSQSITIYPQPSSGEVHIRCPQFLYSISVYSSNGQLVEKVNINDVCNDCNLTLPKKGVFFLHLIGANQVVVKKVLCL